MSVDPIRGVAQSRLTFKRDNAFLTELRRRVDDYFHSSGRRRLDCPAMYLKTAIILAVFGGFYLLLVFMAGAWWQALPLAIGLGLSIAARLVSILNTTAAITPIQITPGSTGWRP